MFLSLNGFVSFMIQAFIRRSLPSEGLYAHPPGNWASKRGKRPCARVHFHVDLNVHIHISANTLRPDQGERIRQRRLDDLRWEDSERRLHGNSLRRQGRRVLQAPFGKARDADPPHGGRRAGRWDRQGFEAHPRRGARAQPAREEIGTGRRMVQIRSRGQGIRSQDEAHEQLLQLP